MAVKRAFHQIACSSCHSKDNFIVAVDIDSEPVEWIVSCQACEEGRETFSSLSDAAETLREKNEGELKH